MPAGAAIRGEDAAPSTPVGGPPPDRSSRASFFAAGGALRHTRACNVIARPKAVAIHASTVHGLLRLRLAMTMMPP